MNNKHIIPLMVLMALMVASCKTTNHVTEYFVDIDSIPVAPIGNYLTTIEPSDELLISVNSENANATMAYNLPMTNPAIRNDLLGTTNPRTQTYIVDSKGYIDMPVLGKVKAAGLTIEQLKDEITRRISVDVKNPLVTVDYVNYFVNVVGEVQHPGRLYVFSPRYSILDALASAGDMTLYGRRDNVLLIREENGQRKHIRFNLNSAETLNSPYFYLKPNDYIYVEPNNVRQDNAEYNQYNSYRLSVVSTIVSGAASIISLIIALTR